MHSNPDITSIVVSRRPSGRSGMTLSELLVSIAVVGVLMAILLPALGMFRESARKASCANNIARISQGFTAYDTAYSILPGWRNAIDSYTTSVVKAGSERGRNWTTDSDGDGVPDGKAEACVSWTVALMPFIGEREIADWYNSFTMDAAVDDVANKRVSLFVCPALTSSPIGNSPLHYFVNGGTGAMALAGNKQVTGDGVCGDAAGNLSSQAWYVKSGGCDDYLPCRYSFADIAEGDGNSNTCLLAERTGPASPIDLSWADNPLPPPNNANNPNYQASRSAHAIMHSRGIHPGYGAPGGGQSAHATENTWMKTRGDNALRYPSSRHEGGFMMAFCDGHVKFASNSIDEWVYTQVLTSDSRPGHLSERVRMFQQMPSPTDGTLVDYLFSASDLDAP